MTESAERPLAPATLPDLSTSEAAPTGGDGAPGASGTAALGLLADVEIELSVEFGRRRMPLGEIARLDVGSVVELDTLAGEPLVIYANGRRIATGEAVVVGGQFGVRIQSLSGPAAG
jgi:flagellar motor switch protein FliN/FliY